MAKKINPIVERLLKSKNVSEASKNLLRAGCEPTDPSHRKWGIPEADPEVERHIFKSIFPEFEFPPPDKEDEPRWLPIPDGKPTGPHDQELVARIQEAWRQYCLTHAKRNRAAFARD